jgi:hypothetical protein
MAVFKGNDCSAVVHFSALMAVAIGQQPYGKCWQRLALLPNLYDSAGLFR